MTKKKDFFGKQIILSTNISFLKKQACCISFFSKSLRKTVKQREVFPVLKGWFLFVRNDIFIFGD